MQITPRIHALTIPFIVPTPAGPLHRSVSVFLHCGAKIILIDSGVAGAEEPIYHYLAEIGSPPDSIAQPSCLETTRSRWVLNATDLPANSMSR